MEQKNLLLVEYNNNKFYLNQLIDYFKCDYILCSDLKYLICIINEKNKHKIPELLSIVVELENNTFESNLTKIKRLYSDLFTKNRISRIKKFEN